MSKAEELSQNRYPTLAEKYAFIDGYEQAEKDLELSWEDIDTIDNLLCEEYNYQLECGKRPQKEACQEVLKRFKEKK